jgi:hypothetical protein
VNGVSQILSGSPSTIQANTDPLRIGVDYLADGRYFNGKIDEVRLWSVVRTEQEIRENMHKTLNGSESGLVAYWQFNEGSGTAANDNAAGNHNGTLTNMDAAAWVTSTVPIGGGTSNSTTSFTSGTVDLGNVRIQTTDDFDNAVDITVTEISRASNTLPAVTHTLNDRYWVVNVFGTPGTFSANLTFTLPSGYLNPSDTQLILYGRDSTGDGSWTQVGTLETVTSTTVQFTGITSFSQFTIGSNGDSSLPVSLSSFTATTSGDNVIIKWRTETEVNNVGFSIYRGESPPLSKAKGTAGEDASSSGNYTKIGFVSGAGNSAMPRNYQFVDKNAEAGKTYFYYLEDIDIAGERSISKIIKVVVPPAKPIPKEFRLLQNYPNPFNPETWIPFDLAADATVTIRIYDVKGQLVRQFDLSNQKAGSYLDKKTAAYWDGKDQLGQSVSSGIYFYTLKAGGFVATRRMVILK